MSGPVFPRFREFGRRATSLDRRSWRTHWRRMSRCIMYTVVLRAMNFFFFPFSLFLYSCVVSHARLVHATNSAEYFRDPELTLSKVYEYGRGDRGWDWLEWRPRLRSAPTVNNASRALFSLPPNSSSLLPFSFVPRVFLLCFRDVTSFHRRNFSLLGCIAADGIARRKLFETQ